jgi:hypothetical protein
LKKKITTLQDKKEIVKFMYEETQTHFLVDNSIPLDGYYFDSFKWLMVNKRIIYFHQEIKNVIIVDIVVLLFFL